MSASFLEQIDWQRPWLSALQPVAEPVLHSSDWRQALNIAAEAQDLRNHRGLRIRFVPQADLPPGVAYEAFISATGGVPTRDNLHDFFNALVWLTFSRIKAQLNALQAVELLKSGTDPHAAPRGKLRDAATIFDENAALLVTCNSELVAALREHRWRDLFIAHRALFERDCDVRVFGHALMEKLVAPYKAITGHVWVVHADQAFFTMSLQEKRAWIDSTVANQLIHGLTTSDFTPLPVLGVPGWWAHQDHVFYDDVTVFRPKRKMR